MAKSNEQIEGVQFVRYFGPLLEALRALGGSGTPGEVVERIARDLRLGEAIQNRLLDSGAPRFPNQVAWARFYLTREGLVDASKRGVWGLTDRGFATKLSHEQSVAIFRKWVKRFAEERKKRREKEPPIEGQAPPPGLAVAADYRDRLAALLASLPAAGFERLSQRLLREAGFVQVVVTGRSGDGGIDGYGTLEVNPLVSFKVLFQCKRRKDAVCAGHVRDFRGAMQGRADKGIILTTGTFTADARREAARDGVPPIELVDGQKIIDMFIKFELGLKPLTTYEVDEAFFEDFLRPGLPG